MIDYLNYLKILKLRDTIFNLTFTSCNGPKEQVEAGTHRVLWGCQDWTVINDYDVPVNPLISPENDGLNFSANRLVSGDFAEGNIGAWQRLGGTSGQVTDWALKKGALAQNNGYLEFACWSGCSGNAVYQDVDASDLKGILRMRFGEYLRPPLKPMP